MNGNKVVNFLQEGHRMQKPEHVDNKLLVEKLSLYFHGNFSRAIISTLFIPVSNFFGNLVPLCVSQMSSVLGRGRSGYQGPKECFQ